jgi:hypothetical protein
LGESEEKVESFITNVSSNDVPPERIIELVIPYLVPKSIFYIDVVPNSLKRQFQWIWLIMLIG